MAILEYNTITLSRESKPVIWVILEDRIWIRPILKIVGMGLMQSTLQT